MPANSALFSSLQLFKPKIRLCLISSYDIILSEGATFSPKMSIAAHRYAYPPKEEKVKKYWIYHPQLRPWTRAFVSPLQGQHYLFIATLLYFHEISDEPNEGAIEIKIEHFVESSEGKAFEKLREWVEKEFGRGMKKKLLDGPDMR